MIRVLVLALLAALAGCATGTVSCTDMTKGACTAQFTRFATDTAISFAAPRGLGWSYTSAPNAQTVETVAKVAASAIALAGTALKAAPDPLPAMLEARELP